MSKWTKYYKQMGHEEMQSAMTCIDDAMEAAQRAHAFFTLAQEEGEYTNDTGTESAGKALKIHTQLREPWMDAADLSRF